MSRSRLAGMGSRLRSRLEPGVFAAELQDGRLVEGVLALEVGDLLAVELDGAFLDLSDRLAVRRREIRLHEQWRELLRCGADREFRDVVGRFVLAAAVPVGLRLRGR